MRGVLPTLITWLTEASGAMFSASFTCLVVETFANDAPGLGRLAGPILGPRPRRKHCAAFRRHAESEQKTTPKTGPFPQQIVVLALTESLLAERSRWHANHNYRKEGTILEERIRKRWFLLGGLFYQANLTLLGGPLLFQWTDRPEWPVGGGSPKWFHYGFYKEQNGATLATLPQIRSKQMKITTKRVARGSPAVCAFLGCFLECNFS